MSTGVQKQWLDLAARAAARGHGCVGPNPPVGCALVAPSGDLIALARHRSCGQAHAEAAALSIAGARAAGSTAHVTLEPCTHQGRTPPCTTALVDAGVQRVVVGALDTNPTAGGGVHALEQAGIDVTVVDHQPSADLIAPHRRRTEDGRPWVRCKWAQTLDGHVATRTGDSRWISSDISRRLVHRERGRVDAVLTGIGTVLADDCQLTVRGVPYRRTPTRVVIDRDLRTPPQSALVASIEQAPLLIVARLGADEDRRRALQAAGADIMDMPCHGSGGFDLNEVLQRLLQDHGIGEVLVEAGPRLMGALMAASLIDEVAVFVAPRLLGDGAAMPALTGLAPSLVRDGRSLRLLGVHRRGDDLLLRYMC
ncbi:MAG: bifunctional diaminohydroxyphosphoribosylaminopyrimidine deaminase/5-amino-6-(5-phosphoribosylamino)uracil reductase RibD [Phycisphaerales bacterium]|nr:bifunctional diaminohydroxyphosphoribosylaminopyrimidine deaminase/5-amino-6-(5-phosphoribosylamino)uracil reductase RibD [Phycisphaerales bacterium]